MSEFPTSFSQVRPLADKDMEGKAAGESLRHLMQNGYRVVCGLNEDYLRQVQALAAEPAMREYTPKDLTERFKDENTAHQWLSKGRAMYLLVKDVGTGQPALAGYGWAGAGRTDTVPNGRNTFAVRIGEIGRGQGLAAPFSWLIIAASAKQYGARDFWLETWQSNGAAVHVYHKLGFQDVAALAAERPAADGGSVADTRLFMELPNDRLSG